MANRPKFARMANHACECVKGESHFSRKWPLASVRESGQSAQHGLANVGEFGESAQHGSANVGKSGESARRDTAWRMSASLASPRNKARRKRA